ncbi:hypothetical protein SAMN05421752_112141 [Natronorubrum thiooxidans]|uniref:Uncharacterized protein n=1 Tax=Natronorubrum thiooxidans TaxID=308853 RepID=A0A1N7GJ73_9EURY|nr:hypothetical protein SAMN05421752_112141 [Natronorubrum thiooxidans]
MDSETLVYFMSIGLIFLAICAAVVLAVAYGAIDVVTDYYSWSGF